MTGARLIILANILPDTKEEDLFTWFNEKHKPDVESSRRFKSATLYRREEAGTLPMVAIPSQRYVTMYELDASCNDDLQDATDGLVEKLTEGTTDLGMHVMDWDDVISFYILPID
jgi:hypothetical protein